MKSMIVIYISFIILSFSSAVFSHSEQKVRLYDIIRKTMNKESNTILFEVRPLKFVVRTTTRSSVKERTESTENTKDINIKKRDSWDSDEEHYFKWASRNRRPMESLGGRK